MKKPMNTRTAIATFSQGHKSLELYGQLIARNLTITSKVTPQLGTESFDLIVFHAGDIPPKHQAYIAEISGTPIKFIDVKKTGPKSALNPQNFRSSQIAEELTRPSLTQHLCHFWFVDFLDYLPGYSHLIHIDDATLILGFPNIIEIMQSEKQQFVCAAQFDQNPSNMVALVEFSKFFRACFAEAPMEFPYPFMVPRTNCMAISLEYLRNNTRFIQFQQAIKNSGMIFTHSWGLGALWGTFAMLYMTPEEKVMLQPSISFLDCYTGAVINPLPNQLEGLVNVALQKPATVNAEYYPPFDGVESAAGNLVSGVFEGNYTMHTEPTDNPYWQVDLLQPTNIQAIQIFNRGDGQQLRAKGLLIEISENGSDFNTIHTQEEIFGGKNQSPLLLDLRMMHKTCTAQFLRIRIPRHECLHLDQVEIYS